MNRNFLEGYGLNKEAIDAIMAENGKDIEAAKGPIAGLNEQITTLKATVSERDTQLETLKKSSGDADALRTTIADLQKANKDKAAEYENNLRTFRIEAAAEKEAIEAGAINYKAVKPFLDFTKATLSEDGTVKGFAEQYTALKAEETTKFLFNAQKQEPQTAVFKGAQVSNGLGTPPDTSSYAARLTKAREAGNTIEALSIKREAADNGVFLM